MRISYIISPDGASGAVVPYAISGLSVSKIPLSDLYKGFG